MRVSARSSKRWSSTMLRSAGTARRGWSPHSRASSRPSKAVDSSCASHRSYGKSLPVHRISAHLGGRSCRRSRELSPAQQPISVARDGRRARRSRFSCQSGSSMAGASFSPREAGRGGRIPLAASRRRSSSPAERRPVWRGTNEGSSRRTFFPCRESASWADHAREKTCLSVGASVTWTDLEEFARDGVPAGP